MTDNDRSKYFRSDKILDTVLETLKKCAKSRGYIVSTENLDKRYHLPLYSTRLLVFFDVAPNALHIDETDAIISRVLSSPLDYIEEVLHYFIEVRSIPEFETCWLFLEFDDRTAYVYMSVRNTNVEESRDGDVISYINLLDTSRQQ